MNRFMFMQICATAPWTPVAARAMLALVFVVAGFNKLQGFDATVGYVGSLTNESVAPFLTVLAIAFELGGGLMLLFNWKVDQAVAMLIAFTIVATILGHSNFSGDSQADTLQVINILKNIAIIGGLLLMGKLTYCCGKESKCCRE